MKRPALFLDRDGVINVDHGYVHTPEEFQFIEGIFDLVAAANRAGYLVVVVTNQAGIGRGYYSEEQFQVLTHWMRARFTEHGGKIDGVYFCPYHPEHGIGEYRRESEFRKPAPGMLLQAQRELDIDMSNSIFVGDKASDMQAGRAAGVGKLILLGGNKLSLDSIPVQKLSDVLTYLKTGQAMSQIWSAPVAEEIVRELRDCFQMGPIVDLDGRELRLLEEELVARLDGLKIEVFSNEHPPPHFRVIYNEESNNFTIKDCQPLNGSGLKKFFKNIRKWHGNNKQELINTWNRMRPSDCPVGLYVE